MVFIYLFFKIFNINNHQINNKITVKLTRLEPPLAEVMSIRTKIKQGKHSHVS